ncbi:hypothetical protein Tco_0766619, partial [Tanacetum coccineum]
AAIKKLVVDSVAAALEAQAATMTNTNNTTRNTGHSGIWIRIFKKRNKKKAKINKAKHGKERAKSSRSLKSST